MTKTQIQTTVVVVLLLAFLGLWVMTRKTTQPFVVPQPQPLAPAPPAPPATSPPSNLPAPPGSPSLVEEPVVERDPFDLPDLLKEVLRQRQREREEAGRHKNERPVTSEVPTPPQPPPLSLQGIFWGTPRPQALINRRILSVGDTIEGARVMAINREGVTVSFQGEQLLLKLPQLSPQDAFRGSPRLEAQPAETGR